MIFSSVEFIFLFLPIFLFSILISKYKKFFIILFSVFFMYLAEGYFIFTLSFIAFINFILARFIFNKYILFFGIVFNLSFLIFYKYLYFLNDIFSFTNKQFDILIPLGISFITFHTISYLVDVHRKKIEYETNFFDFYLFIFMFPQVIAGPITRYSNIYKKIKKLSNRYFKLGIFYFVVGLFQKLIIANTLGQYVDEVYQFPVLFLSSIDTLLVSIIYILQLYFDFSGYSHMAIGLGLIIGVKLPKNFKFPLQSYSISEFWKRWHMSLSTFIRDYLFIPINKFLNVPANSNNFLYFLSILVCFFLSGLWHGANYTFIIWGLLHAFFVIFEKIVGIEYKKNIVTKLYFLFALTLSFIFFRSEDLNQAFDMIKTLFYMNSINNFIILKFINLKFIFVLIISIFFTKQENIKLLRQCYRDYSLTFLGHLSFALLLFILLCELLVTTYNPFIYFKF